MNKNRFQNLELPGTSRPPDKEDALRSTSNGSAPLVRTKTSSNQLTPTQAKAAQAKLAEARLRVRIAQVKVLGGLIIVITSFLALRARISSALGITLNLKLSVLVFIGLAVLGTLYFSTHSRE